MKKASIRHRRLYAVMGADRATVPSLVLDNALWDRLPEKDGIAYRPAPEGSRWSTVLDRDTGARRGILAVLPRSGTNLTETLVKNLERLALKAEELNVPDEGEGAVSALRSLIEEPLLLDVVRDAKVVMTWETWVSGERLYGCPGPGCSSLVAMNAASRLRAHPDDTGASCIRSNTPLTEEERNSEQ
ncbi:hypothetical protein [Streptomyces mirabilis]|uniref:hypothetical protein n=1 Tax=Streptomyces mirabilis TaxID=68239 RepID=UPI00369CF600